jgi:hypothetical protein
MAFAAGNGYGPSNGPTTTQPGYGFTSVLTAQHVNAHGGTLKAKDHFASILLSIPDGAFTKPEQIELTHPKTDLLLAILPSSFTLVGAFGVGFIGPLPHKPITITFYSNKIPANAVVYALVGKKLVKIKFTIHKGRVSITLKANESLVILVPKAKHK